MELLRELDKGILISSDKYLDRPDKEKHDDIIVQFFKN